LKRGLCLGYAADNDQNLGEKKSAADTSQRFRVGGSISEPMIQKEAV